MNPRARLNEVAIRVIRYLWGTGHFTQKQLGATYGLQQGTVSNIVKRRAWRHVA